MQNDLMVISALFACSLVAALVLFKLLQSTALIQKKEYQVGGAAAGFLLIYSALYGSYYQLQSGKADLQRHLKEAQQGMAGCKAQIPPKVTIQGIVDPPIKDALVVLGGDREATDDSGRFTLTNEGVPQSVYVITGKTHMSHNILPDEDLTKTIKIP